MKSLYITESERQQILNLHKSKTLSEQVPAAGAAAPTSTPTPATGAAPAAGTTPAAVTNYTVQQLQQLLISKGYNVGSADNQLGKGTLAQIEAAVKAAKSGTPAAPATTTSLPAPVIAPLDTKKVTGLQTDGSGKVTGVSTTTTGGNTPTTDAGSMTT